MSTILARHCAVEVLFVLTAVALSTVACSNDPSDAQLEAAERARATAVAQQDMAAYSQLAAEDLRVIDRRGAVTTRDDRIDAIESGEARITRRSEGAVTVRRYGDIALVMGQSVWQIAGRENHDYVTRIWLWRGKQWRLVGGHYTDITPQMTANPPGFKLPDNAVPTLPIARTPPAQDAMEQVRRAVTDQHRAYWSKEPDRYGDYAGPDVLRIAENGVRTREELIAGMRGNARLPAPPSDQLDVQVRVYGNVALTGWLDQGTDLLGRPTPNRFTVVFVRRDSGWQMVHIQSTGVKDR
jgi:ketosteroid isomerase-like protein